MDTSTNNQVAASSISLRTASRSNYAKAMAVPTSAPTSAKKYTGVVMKVNPLAEARLRLSLSGKAKETVNLLFNPIRLLHLVLVLMSISVICFGPLDAQIAAVMTAGCCIGLVMCLVADKYMEGIGKKGPAVAIVKKTEPVAATEEKTEPAAANEKKAEPVSIKTTNLVPVQVKDIVQLTIDVCVVLCEVFTPSLPHKMLLFCLVSTMVLLVQVLHLFVFYRYTDASEGRRRIMNIFIHGVATVITSLVGSSLVGSNVKIYELVFKLTAVLFLNIPVLFDPSTLYTFCGVGPLMACVRLTSLKMAHASLFAIMSVQCIGGLGGADLATLLIFCCFYVVLVVFYFVIENETKMTGADNNKTKSHILIRFVMWIGQNLFVWAQELCVSQGVFHGMGESNLVQLFDTALECVHGGMRAMLPHVYSTLAFLASLSQLTAFTLMFIPVIFPLMLCYQREVLWKCIRYIVEKVAWACGHMLLSSFDISSVADSIFSLKNVTITPKSFYRGIFKTDLRSLAGDVLELKNSTLVFTNDTQNYFACVKKMDESKLRFMCGVKDSLFEPANCVTILTAVNPSADTTICTSVARLHNMLALCRICDVLMLKMQHSAAIVEAMQNKSSLRIGGITDMGKKIICSMKDKNQAQAAMCTSVNATERAATFEESVEHMLNQVSDSTDYSPTFADMVNSLYIRVMQTSNLAVVEQQMDTTLANISDQYNEYMHNKKKAMEAAATKAADEAAAKQAADEAAAKKAAAKKAADEAAAKKAADEAAAKKAAAEQAAAKKAADEAAAKKAAAERTTNNGTCNQTKAAMDTAAEEAKAKAEEAKAKAAAEEAKAKAAAEEAKAKAAAEEAKAKAKAAEEVKAKKADTDEIKGLESLIAEEMSFLATKPKEAQSILGYWTDILVDVALFRD